MNQNQPPLLRIKNKDLKNGKISIEKWQKKLLDLYNR
jgi:hypothetical protein